MVINLTSLSKSSRLHRSDLVGIDLGCSIKMVYHNLNIISKMEQVRKDFYIQNIVNENSVHEPNSPGPIDI